MTSRISTLIIVLVLTTSCSTNKIIYVASTLADCEINSSEKCIQVKENKEDEWTVLNNGIEGFAHKDGFLQKIEVSISKIKNKPVDAGAFSYKFVKLIYEQEEKLEAVMEVPFSLVLDKNHAGIWKVNSMMGMDSLPKQPTLIFKDGQASGNAGCNSYTAAFTLNNGNEITFGLIMATKMHCTNMPIEKAYFDCLSKTKTYKLLDNKLTLYNKDSAELMQCTLLKEE